MQACPSWSKEADLRPAVVKREGSNPSACKKKVQVR